MIQETKKSFFSPTQTLTLATRISLLIITAIVDALNLGKEKENVETGINTLDDSLSRTLSSDYTQKLREADDKCDDAVRFLTNFTRSFIYHHVAEKRDAGTILYNVIKQHIPNVNNLGYVNEMARITALGTELQQNKYKAAAQILDVATEIQYMIDSKDAFEKLYVEKNVSEKDKADTITTRLASQALLVSLEELIEKLNAHLLLNPTDELQELAKSLNSVIDSVSQASK